MPVLIALWKWWIPWWIDSAIWRQGSPVWGVAGKDKETGARKKPLMMTLKTGVMSLGSLSLVSGAGDNWQQLSGASFKKWNPWGSITRVLMSCFVKDTPEMNLLRILQMRMWKLWLLLLANTSTLSVQTPILFSFHRPSWQNFVF